jgi:hypothetical protein
MATILPFPPVRKYRLTNVIESPFIKSDSPHNRDFAVEDLARSGLTIEQIDAGVHPTMRIGDKALAGYTIPYYGLDGQPICDADGGLVMYRVRLKHPEFSRESRYTQPSAETLAKYNLPPTVPYLHPLSFTNEGKEVVVCEGEKKTAAVLHRLGLPAFGIGGCQMWRAPGGSGGVHPWIMGYLKKRGILSVRIVPDGDVFRYDICNAYGTFARALESEGITVTIVNPAGKIDDLLLEWGAEASERFSQLESIPLNDLVQSPASLIAKFGLAFKVDTKDRPIVYQHSSNVTKILEQHRGAFPEIWRNTDTNTLMFGDKEARPDLTEVEVTNYFQHNLGFFNVKSWEVLKCMVAQGKKNERSPFLQYIQSQIWDGKPRLETWFQELWGIPDSEYVREVGRKWMVSSCARLDKPGTKIDWMLIIIGGMGIGKTSMPNVLFRSNYQPIYGEHSDKDLHQLMHSKLCIGFDELDSFGKRESSMLRALITQSTDSFRPPYGTSVEVFPRRFVLYGCGNKRVFLHDTDGQRRYSILDAGQRKLNFAGLEEIRAQLWAEAWHLYTGGGLRYWEVEGNAENAHQYEIPNPMQEAVDAFLYGQAAAKYAKKNANDPVYFLMSQVLQHLDIGKVGPNSTQVRDIAEFLVKAGCIRPDRSGCRHPETKELQKWWIWQPPLASN